MKEKKIQCEHLRGIEMIAKAFGVSRATARFWRKMGAPMTLIGKKYQANYLELWEWLKKNRIEKQE